jgi:hypothetical protein
VDRRRHDHRSRRPSVNNVTLLRGRRRRWHPGVFAPLSQGATTPAVAAGASRCQRA